MPVSITKIGQGGDAEALTRQSQNQLQSQLNAQPRALSQRPGAQQSIRNGDNMFSFGTAGLTITQGAAKGSSFKLTIPQGVATYAYVDPQSGTVPPTVADNFPTSGQYGWYFDTSASKTYWVINNQGVLATPTLSTLDGTITATQHSDLSAAVATMHGFAQISGTITGAQHGNISGSTNAGDYHDAASSTFYGFLSPTHYSLLANATNAATGSTLVLRNAGGNADFANVGVTGAYYVDGKATVTGQQSGWSACTGSPTIGGYPTYSNPGYADPNLNAVANALVGVSSRLAGLINTLRTIGLLAT